MGGGLTFFGSEFTIKSLKKASVWRFTYHILETLTRHFLKIKPERRTEACEMSPAAENH